MAGVEELKASVLEKTNWSEERLELEITAQQERFAGLLTREGALEIIARESGLKLADKESVVFIQLVKARALAGGVASVRVRIWHVFSPKKFVKRDEKGGERVGRVCNLLVRDASGEATLVLWGNDVALVEKGVIERNDVLEVRGAFVKSSSPLELHSSLLTRLVVVEGDFPELPVNSKQAIALSSLSEGMQDADFYGRVLRVGKTSEFVRIAKNGMQEKGLLCDCTLSDGKASLRCVAWDENARALERAKPGDALKAESAYMRRNAKSQELEAHLGWQGHVVLSPKAHALAESKEIWGMLFPRRLLSELSALGEGEQALVTAKVVELRGASVASKCVACGTRCDAPPCPSCSGEKLRSFLVVRTRLDDGFANIACVFFGRQALELLGMKELSVEPATALELKRDYLLGREISVVLQARLNERSGELEAVAKHVVSLSPNALDEAQALAARLGN